MTNSKKKSQTAATAKSRKKSSSSSKKGENRGTSIENISRTGDPPQLLMNPMVDSVSIPNRVYKYQPPSILALANLSAAGIWFADPTTFNDPFDCALEAIDHSVEASLKCLDAPTCLDVLLKLRLAPNALTAAANMSSAELRTLTAASLRTAIKNAFSRGNGVCCFSESVDDLLMWGHYADSHRGFCLEFDTTVEPFSIPNKLKRVTYCNSFPALNTASILNGDYSQLIEFLVTKACCWSYEREWRLFHGEMNKQFFHVRPALTAIYFGARMTVQQQMMVATLLDQTDTKLFQMTLDRNQFKLTPNAVTFTRTDYRKLRSEHQT